ncbi:MAG TPA: hypothetical protein VFB80_11375 [Pirellulaceae bacterium]|nr:hypothetical protein [Pirellulaceae bacterium]
MPVARHFAVLAVAAGLVAGARAADPPAPPPKPEQVARLITDLGSEEFTVREAATDTLTRIGLPAFAALEAAATHSDREVRYRSQRILGLIREHDLKRRLEAFLSGKEAEGDYPLPGWTRFKKTYGDEGQTRSLFVEMQRAEPDLLRALEEGPRGAADAVSQRVAQVQEALRFGGQPQFTPGQVVSLLFVASEDDVSLPAATMTLFYNLCYQQPFREAIEGQSRGGVPRKMLASLIRRSDENSAYMAMQVAYQLNMPEGIDPALKILNGKGGVRVGTYSAYALATVVRTGDAAHLPLVEKLLTDASQVTQIQQNNVITKLQLRDSALAAAILLTKQELKDYFDLASKPAITEPRSILINPSLIGFKTDAEREAVFKKWEVYKARQPQQPAEKPAPSP